MDSSSPSSAMSAFQLPRRIRQWLDVVSHQLEVVSDRLRDESDPVELTPAGEAAFAFLAQSREALTRGTMVLEGEMRRALDLLMLCRAIAYRPCWVPSSRTPDPTPYRCQEVARNYTLVPSGRAHTSSSTEAGGSGPHDIGYVYFPANSKHDRDADSGSSPGLRSHDRHIRGGLHTHYLLSNGQILNLAGDLAEIYMCVSWAQSIPHSLTTFPTARHGGILLTKVGISLRIASSSIERGSLCI
jgi:hypothetical protein